MTVEVKSNKILTSPVVAEGKKKRVGNRLEVKDKGEGDD